MFEKGLEPVGQGRALIDHGAAVQDQLLQPPGLGVLGHPGLEFVGVSEEQFGQVLGILAVVLGATGDEGLAELLEREGGIDGEERDPGVGLQEEDQVEGGLLDTERDAGPRVILPQLGQPVVEALGGGVQGLAPSGGRSGGR